MSIRSPGLKHGMDEVLIGFLFVDTHATLSFSNYS
jgi:hypothetical protein